VDLSTSQGVILDENEQEITFCLNALSKEVELFEGVEFQIELVNDCLAAVNVQTLRSDDKHFFSLN